MSPKRLLISYGKFSILGPSQLWTKCNIRCACIYFILVFQIEKAKKLTKSLGNQIENIECPEPNEPPLQHSQQIPPRNYNKKIINNQMPHPFAYFPAACSQVLPYGSIPLGLNVPRTTFNSNMWAVPPMFMATSSPVIQQAHTSVNVTYSEQDYEVLAQDSGITVASRFPSHCKTYDTRQKFIPNSRLNKQHFGQRNYGHKLGSNDLRNVLSARMSHNYFKNTSKKSEGNFVFINIILLKITVTCNLGMLQHLKIFYNLL